MKVNKLISPKGAFAPKDNYTPSAQTTELMLRNL